MATLFTFTRVDTFLDDINREDCFDTQDMDGVTPNYKIVLASECGSNLSDCIDEMGTLITPYNASTRKGVTLVESYGEGDGEISMLWSKGINGARTMSVADSVVSYDFEDETVDIKAAFLINIGNGSGYVIAYSMNNRPISVSKSLIMPVDSVVWSMQYGG